MICRMQAVILAAGRGRRMGPLTEHTPKPLLSYRGQTLLEQKLSILPSSVAEIIIVIGYLGQNIINAIGHSYNNIPIRYVWQTELTGTAGALWLCKEFLYGPFIVLMSDDIYHHTDIARICDTSPHEWSVLLSKSDDTANGGKCTVNESGYLDNIVEDMTGTIPYTYIYTGVCVLTPEVFKLEPAKLSNGEYGLPQTFVKQSRERNINVLFATEWLRITDPDDLQ